MTKSRILIVEDEVIVAMHLRLILERLGYECVGQVTSGEEAVKVAASTSPDLIIMDIRLSGDMDGIEAARRILANTSTRVVYATAYADASTMRRAMDSTSPAGYVLKPFVEHALRKTLEEALAKGISASGQAAHQPPVA